MATERTDNTANNRKEYGPCEERTIMLMGRTRTGKSTIAEVLANTLYKPRKLSIYSETRQTTARSFFTTDKNTGKSYRFTIIDTPGFFDMTHDSRVRLQNKDITEHIRCCLESNIRHVHLIGIVFNLVNGINERDIEAMIYIKEHFRGIEEHTALIITNCEQTNEKERNRLIDDFFQHRVFKKHNLKDFFRQGVLFMGCLRYESLETANEAAIYLEYNNVLDMRTEFIEKCIRCTNTFSFRDSACSIM
jgi:GTPase Era involved in 16S rRNA processing